MTDTDITQQILETFDLSGAVLLPALVVLVLAVARVNVKLTLLLSWLLAMGLAVGLQQNSLGQMLQFTLWGFRLEPGHGLEAMLLGGGLWPMGKVCSAVFFSTALSGLLSGTGSLQGVDRWLRHLRGTRPLFAGTAFTSFVSAAFGCTQTIAIVLTHQLVRPAYQRQSSGRVATNLAIDLENTAVVIAPLVPWNIAGLVPAAVLMAGPGFIPYAVYLYLVPLCNWVWPRRGYSLILRPSPMGNRALID